MGEKIFVDASVFWKYFVCNFNKAHNFHNFQNFQISNRKFRIIFQMKINLNVADIQFKQNFNQSFKKICHLNWRLTKVTKEKNINKNQNNFCQISYKSNLCSYQKQWRRREFVWGERVSFTEMLSRVPGMRSGAAAPDGNEISNLETN